MMYIAKWPLSLLAAIVIAFTPPAPSSAEAVSGVSESLFLPVINSLSPPVPPFNLVTLLPSQTADWWQWIERMNDSPIFETGSVDCSRGQTGSVWFLAGNSGIPTFRDCTIPTGITLVVPVWVVVWHNEGDEDLTVEEKRKVLDELISDKAPGDYNTQICRLNSSIDGAPISTSRVQSPPFALPGDLESVSDGFWVAAQLAPGSHQLHFAGALCTFGTDEISLLASPIDVTYRITVQ